MFESPTQSSAVLTDLGTGLRGRGSTLYLDRALRHVYHRCASSESPQGIEHALEWLKQQEATLLVQGVGSGEAFWVFQYGDGVGLLEQDSRGGSHDWLLSVSGPDDRVLCALTASFHKAFPERAEEKASINVSFWLAGSRGPRSRSRPIAAPAWEEISRNYPMPTVGGLDRLVALKEPENGQLILLRGQPGTGKTYAIRSLVREWRSWCKPHYITDPEAFFGSTEYMFHVLFGDDDDDYSPPVLHGVRPASRWSLLILEDSDEFITNDAKVRSGQSLGRLLNLVDGFLGQGLRVLVLITTNEELGKIHPAVIRPGRCLADIEFGMFAQEEAQDWLHARGNGKVSVRGPKTLAELYAALRDGKIPESKVIGFVGG